MPRRGGLRIQEALTLAVAALCRAVGDGGRRAPTVCQSETVREVHEASKAIARIIGREPECAVLSEFLETAAPVRALVLTGAPGIGKTTLWEAGIEVARERGLRVLSARPSGAEARLSFAALIDLFDAVETRAMAGLPAPQRVALEVALLRAEPTGAPPQQHAIDLGLLNGLRTLAAGGPVLVAIDDRKVLFLIRGKERARGSGSESSSG